MTEQMHVHAMHEMLGEGEGQMDVTLYRLEELVEPGPVDHQRTAAIRAFKMLCEGNSRGCLFCDKAFTFGQTKPPRIVGVLGASIPVPRQVLIFMVCEPCAAGGDAAVLRAVVEMVRDAAEQDENPLAWITPAGSA